MINKELTASTDSSKKKFSSWDWIWPSIVGAAIVKLFGLVGGLVTIGAYYWLKPKIGVWSALAISGILGILAAIGLSVMLGNVSSISSKAPTIPSEKKTSTPNLKPTVSSEFDSSNIVSATPKLIPSNIGISINVKGVSANGQLLVQIINDTSTWEVTDIDISLINAEQHVDILNGHRVEPAYSENYSTEISVSPHSAQSIEIPVAWNYRINYLTETRAHGFKKKEIE